MIKAKRVLLCGDIVYDDVEIYKYGEPGGKYLPNMFERYQIYIKNKVIKTTTNSKLINMVQLRRETPKPYMIPLKRIVITYGQISFGPAYLIPEDRYDELNIPFLFKYDYKDVDHCAIIADNWLFLTRDELVISMEH